MRPPCCFRLVCNFGSFLEVKVDMVVGNEEAPTSWEYAPEELKPAPEEELGELLQHLEDYTPTVPDALAEKYLHSAGFEAVDPRIVRIISVTAQKFISDIANDALQHCKTRSNSQHSGSHGSNKDKKSNKDRKYTLAIEDLTPALADHGITMRKPQYFV